MLMELKLNSIECSFSRVEDGDSDHGKHNSYYALESMIISWLTVQEC